MPHDDCKTKSSTLKKAAIFLPIVACIHVVEEWQGGFILEISELIKGVTWTYFWVINAMFVGFGLIAALLYRRAPLMILSALALIGINALIHTAASIALRTYSPGLISALALYAPLVVWTFRSALRNNEITHSQTRRAILAGAGLMAIAPIFQGVRILLGL